MLSQKLQDALSEHIRNEHYSSYLYLAMASYCESRNFPGFAHWLRIQSEEERLHSMKLFTYLHDRGARPVLQAIAKPPHDFGSLAEVFRAVLEHEREVSAGIHRLYELALAEKDYPTQVLLQWFISEQVEEEKTAAQIHEQLQMIPERSGGIFYLDKKLGKRVLSAPPA
jgi:ferritin